MREVWKAHDTRLDRTVASKFPRAVFTGRFHQEALLPFPTLRGPRLSVHLAASAGSEAELARMQVVLETSLLARPR